MLELCLQTRGWHLLKKKNVYNRNHLRLFFGDEDNVARENSAKTRELFNKILRTKALEAMQKPKSQIKNKVHYLTVTKIFSLRCRSKILSLRNQSRWLSIDPNIIIVTTTKILSSIRYELYYIINEGTILQKTETRARERSNKLISYWSCSARQFFNLLSTCPEYSLA